ncbi:MAG TPA: hypothetical protein VE988_08450 [Gemmataceae bacterium]|nr:hypothetical protein [Gemmataceae bacterium]
MTQNLNLHPDFPLVVGYFRQRSGKDVTIGQLTDLIAQTAPEELALAVGPEVAATAGRDIDSIRFVFADNMRIRDVLTFLELRNRKVSDTPSCVPREKWRQVELGLKLVYGSLLWFMIFIGFLALVVVPALVFDLKFLQRFLSLVVVEVGIGLLIIPVFSYHVMGQVKCCTIPDSSGARPAMLLNALLVGIGCSGICGIAITVVIGLENRPASGDPILQQVVQQLAAPDMALATIAIRAIFPLAHIIFTFGLIRMCHHLGHRGVALFGSIYLIAAAVVNIACFLLPFLLMDAMKQAASAAEKAPPGGAPPSSVVLAGFLVIAFVGFSLLACVLQIVFLIFVGYCRRSVESVRRIAKLMMPVA